MTVRGRGPTDRAVDLALRAALGVARSLPYERRVAAMGALTARALGPLAATAAGPKPISG